MTSSLLRVYLHLVWTTHARQPLISGALEPALHDALGQRCQENGAKPLAIGGVEDHVHLLVVLPATWSVAALAKDLKGWSSHFANRVASSTRLFRWQRAYGAFSVGEDSVEAVRGYIERQREHHARGDAGGWESELRSRPAGWLLEPVLANEALACRPAVVSEVVNRTGAGRGQEAEKE